MSVTSTILTGCLAAVSLSACNQPFSPKGMFQDRMVVYCILSTRSDTVYARVLESYDPPGFDPLAQTAEKVVADAAVTVTGPDGSVTLRDTLVQRDDTTRYGSLAKSFAGYRYAIRTGATYTLTVASAKLGKVSAVTTVPDSGTIGLAASSAAVINHPFTTQGQDIAIQVWLSPKAKGILLRVYVEFEARGRIQQVEVPAAFAATGDSVRLVYPSLQRAVLPGGSASPRTLLFSGDAYTFTINRILATSGSVTFRRLKLSLAQVDQPLYDYYSVVNGFRDPRSIRTDIPDNTNVQGGLGVFGSFTVDSMFYQLPQSFQ